jgi:hypothetical protein
MTGPVSCLSERVIANLSTLLQSITTANGFETNAGQRVFRARQSIEKREVDCVNVWEGQETPQAASQGRDKMDMRLLVHIEGHVEARRDDTGERLGKIKADIKRAICSGSRNGGLPDPPNRPFATILYLGSEPLPRPDGSDTESVTLTFSINYPEAYGDPYTTG